MTMHKKINLLGIRVDLLETKQLCEQIISFVQDGKQHKVMYVNADCMLISLKDRVYKQILNEADLTYADGIGIVWGARLWGYHITSRSTAADFMPDLCKDFAKNGFRIYLLGAKEGVAEEAATKLLQMVPNLQIGGTHHGYFKKEENEQIIDEINKKNPHVLLVGFGAPHQEKWIEENASKLKTPVIWGVGGLFNFIAGRTWRGPRWLLDHGFEWLCRLIAEPRRLWRRYLIGNTRFIITLLWHRFTTPRKL